MDSNGDLYGLAALLSAAVVIFIIYLIIKYGVRSGVRSAGSGMQMREGVYVVYGVNKQSKADISVRVFAHSGENAKVKAELEGIAVTSVKWYSA